jgi:hypothetical protein
VYEHLAGIRIAVGDAVAPGIPIGRFMTNSELNRYGWQFDHLHFEVLRLRPRPAQPTKRLPMRLFQTYALVCADCATLSHYYFDPETFLENTWHPHR